MAFTDVLRLDTVSLSPNTYALAPRALNVGTTRIRLALSRDSWPDTGSEVITLNVDVSLDGGSTWLYHYGVGAMGGIAFNRDGSVAIFTELFADLPEPANPNRMARANAQVFTTLQTSVLVQAE